MQEYFLVLDTETSGLPKNWSEPYSKENNWPYIIQIGWIVFDSNHKEIHRENHYIKDANIVIEKSSQDIHHITADFLNENGLSRKLVFDKLANDVIKYKPLIVGHFIEFDYQMLGAEYYRLGLQNILTDLPTFCTMKASKSFVRNPDQEFLKLNQFYGELFNEDPKSFHNAISDAKNTARIFFRLIELGIITEENMFAQHNNFIQEKTTTNSPIRKFIKGIFNG